MPTIHFIREDKRVEVPEGTNLRAYCKGAGVQIYPWHARIGNCLGNGLCGTCLVRVDDAEGLSARTLAEDVKLGAQFPGEFRLACQAQVVGDVRVLTQPNLPQGWHTHPAYRRMADPNPFEGLPSLGEERQAEADAAAPQEESPAAEPPVADATSVEAAPAE